MSNRAAVTPEDARRHVRRLRAFYAHLVVFLLVNAGLAALNLLVGRRLWFLWVTVPWGMTLAARGLSLAGPGFLGKAWEERKVDEYLARERRAGP